ncbi:Cif family virulence factor [Flavobacterium selenitireducens]|uniref:nuclear transport factor 2 family protein n=1 Tax=Flavobacterium selenitireducens TaxID=2722704 RepID=UPI00168AD9C0|nr:nuclear transport factor 2 family protein [Flavobacterium selenitireducens]MBD3581209.1 nuclear transport factor 2 family protein [Flavobacterium selenitireducens]
MKQFFILSAILLSQITFAQDPAIKKTIEDFFAAFHAHDTVALRKTLAKEIAMHSISERSGQPKITVESVPEFFKSIATTPSNVKFEEKLLSWEIKQDGSMAHVWTKYEFHINGKLSHGGVNSFSLAKASDGWKILYCVDTRRKL